MSDFSFAPTVPKPAYSIDYNAVADIVRWLMSHGAPAPTLKTLHASYPGGVGWDWDTLEFANAGDTDKPYILSIPTLMGNANTNLSASTALTEMQTLGIMAGDAKTHVTYTPPAPVAPPKPQRVDVVVGLERPDQPGSFDGADYIDYMQFLNRGTLYNSPSTGRKFKPEMIGSGMFARYVWTEVK